MEYSAVIQPPGTPCSFIQRGTISSTVTPQITRVLPHSTSVDPVAYGAMPFWKRTGLSSSSLRPSAREIAEPGGRDGGSTDTSLTVHFCNPSIEANKLSKLFMAGSFLR